MSSPAKTAQLVTKLIRLTSEDRLAWELKNPPDFLTRGTDDVFPFYFETEYKEKGIAVYEQRYQAYDPDYDRHYWQERSGISLIDEYGRVIWESSSATPGLYDLINLVREKTSGIDDLLDDLLDEGDDE